MRWPAALLLPGLASAFGCASEADVGGVPLSVTFTVDQGDQSVACKDQPGIEGVEVRLFSPNNGQSRPGFPKPGDCQTGTFEAFVDAGDHVLEVAGLGPLGADPRATLFLAHSNVTLPADGPIRLSMAPQVAFLDLEWTFEGGAACPDEVDHLELVVTSPASQTPAFRGQLACGESPQRIAAPFDLTTYTIDLRAVPLDGPPLYVHTASRLFNRGVNKYLATLTARGGRLHLDWEFGIADQRIRACGDDQVAVDNVTITVVSREGDQPISETVPCSASRPYAFRNGRFLPSRQLTLELVAEGAARFSASVPFTMPSGDYHSELIGLEARGGVMVGLMVGTATCAPAGARFDLALYTADRQPLLVAEASLTRADELAHFEALEYGRYEVVLESLTQSGSVCTTRSLRTVDAREQLWAPLEL